MMKSKVIEDCCGIGCLEKADSEFTYLDMDFCSPNCRKYCIEEMRGEEMFEDKFQNS